jgi:hypothetical protein
MITYATLNDLRHRRDRMLSEERASIVKRASERSPAGSTFLSHSTADSEYLPGVINLLEAHGATVYIDKKDPSLPPFTSRETAVTLRQRIAKANKFVLFATKASKDSRWMPWELGISDGVKNSTRTAILPGVDNVTEIASTEQEYLGIYDRVVFGDLQGQASRVWMVLNQEKNTATELSAWLQTA